VFAFERRDLSIAMTRKGIETRSCTQLVPERSASESLSIAMTRKGIETFSAIRTASAASAAASPIHRDDPEGY
jgi:hypothetical protein